MGHPAEFAVLAQTDRVVLIADLDRELARSVTNDAENVVPRVDREVCGLGQRRLYYMDSVGDFDELVHDGQGAFVRFAPGPVRLDRLRQWVALTGRQDALPAGSRNDQEMRDFIVAFGRVVHSPVAADTFMEAFDRVLKNQRLPARNAPAP